jgi:group II intron reverse transcriptase/maturase
MNVKEVQRRLWEQSKSHRENREANLPLFPANPYDLRVRNLSDLIHHPEWLGEAAERVFKCSRGKASGVDGMTVAKFLEHGRENAQTLKMELKKGNYKPQPLRRVEIPKANGKMRPLGIPCLRDKIVQEAVRMALEPIFEVEFHDNSYGFRPNRNAHHAVLRCQRLMQRGFTWVIEGDVKACFDDISHRAILGVVREKVMDNKFLDLLQLFLESGVIIDGQLHPTVKGVPQGGIVSPLLSNAVLNKLDWFLQERAKHGFAMEKARRDGAPNLRFARYADDWCVFLTRANKRYAESLRDEIREFLSRIAGLSLSMEKTCITHVQEGFDFLGFHLERGIGMDGKPVPKIKIGQKAKANARLRLEEAIRYRPAQESIAARIGRASAVIRGWSNYFKIAHDFAKVASSLDNSAYEATLKAICRKHRISTKQCLKKFYFDGRLGVSNAKRLAKFKDTRMLVFCPGPKPYQPGYGCYLEDDELEADFRLREGNRLGSEDTKWEALRRDNYRCRLCGCRVLSNTSHLDHIKPVRRFANFVQANSHENTQTLCLRCHKLKTSKENKKA